MYKIPVENLTSDNHIITTDRKVEAIKAIEPFSKTDRDVLIMKRKELTVDIIVVVHDDLSAAVDCIESVCTKTTDILEWKLTVIDNACDEFAAQELLKLKRRFGFALLRMNQYNGYLPAMHIAVTQTKNSWIVFVNAQVTVSKGWLEGIIWSARSNVRVGMVSPWTSKRLPLMRGSNVDDMGARIHASGHRKSPATSFPVETCFAIKRQALKECGGLDVEYYGPGYGEAADLYMRLINKRWLAVRANTSYVLDQTHGRADASVWLNGESAGRERFLSRWGDEAFKSHARRLHHDTAQTAASRLLSTIVPALSTTNSRPQVVFCFRDFELCGATLAATHICNRLIDLGWDASFAHTGIAPGNSLKHLPMKFKPYTLTSKQNLVGTLRKRLTHAVLIAPTWLNVEDVNAICDGRKDLTPVYYVQDDERRFTRPNGKSYTDPKNITNAYKQSKHLVCNSQWVQKVVKKFGHESELIPIGVDTLMFRPAERSDERIRVMAHCRPSTPRRGWAFIQAVLNRAVAEVDFEFVGYDQEYEKSEMAVPWHGNLGPVSPGELALQMRTAHIFIEGSQFQGFGMQSLEAMACGCALLNTNNGGSSEYCENGKNSLVVEYGDVKTAAKYLVQMISLVSRRKVLGAAARETAEKFDWRIIAGKWNSYLRKLI